MIYAAILAALAGTNASNLATEPTAVVVPYVDLDLGSAAGRRELDRRILRAARKACDEQRLPSAEQQARIAECTNGARLRAQHDVEIALAKRSNGTELARNQIGGAHRL